MTMDMYAHSPGRWYGAPTVWLEQALFEGQRFVVVASDRDVKIGDTLAIRETVFKVSHIAKPYPFNPQDVVPTGGITLSLVKP
jgi:hypothetical protein